MTKRRKLRPGDAFLYTNSNALGLVHFVGINPHTGAVVVTNSEATDRHIREISSFDVLKRHPSCDVEPPTYGGYLLKKTTKSRKDDVCNDDPNRRVADCVHCGKECRG